MLGSSLKKLILTWGEICFVSIDRSWLAGAPEGYPSSIVQKVVFRLIEPKNFPSFPENGPAVNRWPKTLQLIRRFLLYILAIAPYYADFQWNYVSKLISALERIRFPLIRTTYCRHELSVHSSVYGERFLFQWWCYSRTVYWAQKFSTEHSTKSCCYRKWVRYPYQWYLWKR